MACVHHRVPQPAVGKVPGVQEGVSVEDFCIKYPATTGCERTTAADPGTEVRSRPVRVLGRVEEREIG